MKLYNESFRAYKTIEDKYNAAWKLFNCINANYDDYKAKYNCTPDTLELSNYELDLLLYLVKEYFGITPEENEEIVFKEMKVIIKE